MDQAGAEIIELSGVRIPLDPAVMSQKICDQLRAGRYEEAEARRLPQILEPGERLVELGAGIGFLTAVAGVDGRAAAIVAVEANPALIPLIETVHRINGVASIVRHGVASPGAPAAQSHSISTTTSGPRLCGRSSRGTCAESFGRR